MPITHGKPYTWVCYNYVIVYVCLVSAQNYLLFFKRFNLFIFREGGKEGERQGEKHQCEVASHALPTGDLACNPGTCPDWESNWRFFGSHARTQSTEPHQPGLRIISNDRDMP